jgi:hypothetical protein
MPVHQYTPQDYIDALNRNDGSRVKTAKELDVGVRQVFKMLEMCKKLGMDVPPPPNYAPSTDHIIGLTQPAHEAAPEGYTIRGVSTLVGSEGELKQQWIKTQVDDQRRMELIQAAVLEMCKAVPPLEPATPPAHFAPKLCNTYVFSDFHMGMLAWHREGGADWDLPIAKKVLLGCFEQMLATAPPAETGFLLQLGDFLHTDGLVPVTPGHGHVLDADSRFSKIVEATVDTLRTIVNRMLEKHSRVHVVMAEGNHDISSSVWLRALFKALYDKEPRITVDDSPLPYYAFKFGKTMISAHHGHLTKTVKLDSLIPAQFAKMWGETEFRYVHCGHVHHEYEKEHSGITVVQHPTLASRDAYAARGGWHARRAARCDTYHSDFGQVARTIVTPEMVA